MQEHSTLPRRLSLPGLIVITFHRLSSRRRLQSLRPSETFQRLVRHETSICRVLQIPSRPRCHGVTLVRKLRFTALYWPSNGVSLQKRTPKASTDDHPSTQKLHYLDSFPFDSLALIATLRHIASTTRTAMPCAPRSHPASGDRDPDGWPGPRPTRPRPPPQFSSNFTIAIFWVRVSQKNVCQTHSHLIHLWETKPRWEKAKKKKKRRLISRGGFVRNLRTMLCTPLSVQCVLQCCCFPTCCKCKPRQLLCVCTSGINTQGAQSHGQNQRACSSQDSEYLCTTKKKAVGQPSWAWKLTWLRTECRSTLKRFAAARSIHDAAR